MQFHPLLFLFAVAVKLKYKVISLGLFMVNMKSTSK